VRLLPDQCTLEGDALVFWEVAHPEVLENIEALYEYVCFTACTHALRPSGQPTVVVHDFPSLETGQVALWGGRSMTADSIESFRDGGLVLAEIRLGVAAMGGAAAAVVEDSDLEIPRDHPNVASQGAPTDKVT